MEEEAEEEKEKIEEVRGGGEEKSRGGEEDKKSGGENEREKVKGRRRGKQPRG